MNNVCKYCGMGYQEFSHHTCGSTSGSTSQPLGNQLQRCECHSCTQGRLHPMEREKLGPIDSKAWDIQSDNNFTLMKALVSIANNFINRRNKSFCGDCQEAKKVAQSALNSLK